MLRAKPVDDDMSEIFSTAASGRSGRQRRRHDRSGALSISTTKSSTKFDDASTTDDMTLATTSTFHHHQAPSRASIAKSAMKKAGTTGATAAKVVGKGVGKGIGVAGNRLGVASKGTVKLGAKTAKGTLVVGAKTAKGTLTASKFVAKKSVGAARSLPTNAIDVAGLTGNVVKNLPGNAIHLAGHTVKGVTNLATRTLKRNEVVAAAAWKTRVTSPVTKIELELSCKNLRRKDAFSESDAFCVVWQVPSGYGNEASIGKLGDESFSSLNGSAVSGGHLSLSSILVDGQRKKRPRVNRLPTHTEKEIGRTEVVKGQRHPDFQHTFTIDYHFDQEQTYVVRVYDRDLEYCQDLKEHDFLGGTVFTMGELMGVGKRVLRRPLRGAGSDKTKSFLYIKGSEVSSTRSIMEFRFSAEDLKEKDKVIEKDDDLYFQIDKLNMEDQTWHPVYKSEVIWQNNKPTWAGARVPLPVICNDDIRTPLKITFWDWVRGGQSEALGYVETTCQMLIHEAERGIPVFDVWKEHKRMFGRSKTKKSGKLKVLRAELKPVPTMLEYICGGCQLDLMIAVDCSIHNGDPNTDSGLHHRPGPMWLNDYQAAINKIGTIMEPYSNNSEFTIWGFGGTIRGESVAHFPLGEEDGNVKGASGLLDAYDMSFIENPLYIEPAEEASIEPLIQSAMYRAIQKSEGHNSSYSVLCILTAGKIGEDLRDTIDVLCTAAEDAPLSIIIIGVGYNHDDFDIIKMLLANGGKLRHSNGVPMARDVVGFAAFCDYEDNSTGKVVGDSLKDLPEQFTEYFTANGILPRPPITKSSSPEDEMMDDSRVSMGGSSGRMGGGSSRRHHGNGMSGSSRRHHSGTTKSRRGRSGMGGSSRRRHGRSDRSSRSPKRSARTGTDRRRTQSLPRNSKH